MTDDHRRHNQHSLLRRAASCSTSERRPGCVVKPVPSQQLSVLNVTNTLRFTVTVAQRLPIILFLSKTQVGQTHPCCTDPQQHSAMQRCRGAENVFPHQPFGLCPLSSMPPEVRRGPYRLPVSLVRHASLVHF